MPKPDEFRAHLYLETKRALQRIELYLGEVPASQLIIIDNLSVIESVDDPALNTPIVCQYGDRRILKMFTDGIGVFEWACLIDPSVDAPQTFSYHRFSHRKGRYTPIRPLCVFPNLEELVKHESVAIQVVRISGIVEGYQAEQ